MHAAGGLVPRLLLLLVRRYAPQLYCRSTRRYYSQRAYDSAVRRAGQAQEQVCALADNAPPPPPHTHIGVCACLRVQLQQRMCECVIKSEQPVEVYSLNPHNRSHASPPPIEVYSLNPHQQKSHLPPTPLHLH